MPSAKPVLALSTPVTANFPRDVPREIPSAVSLQTPLSAQSLSKGPLLSAGLPSAGLPSAGLSYTASPIGPLSARTRAGDKTPITPPLAYLDFLRSTSMASPPATAASGKPLLNRQSTRGSVSSHSSSATSNPVESNDSGPSTATSERTDCSCKCEDGRKPSHKMAPANADLSESPVSGLRHPLSAPAIGPGSYPGRTIPPSPARPNPAGTAKSPKTPWSARPAHSAFDWEAALKARRPADTASAAAAAMSAAANGCGTKREGKPSVRQIREVMTRTVTYTQTPRMAPAPKGKRRKVDHETAVET